MSAIIPPSPPNLIVFVVVGIIKEREWKREKKHN